MKVNGGSVVAVEFGAALQRLQRFEEALINIANDSEVYSANPAKWPATIAQAAIDNSSGIKQFNYV
jgi:hypothetical protein